MFPECVQLCVSGQREFDAELVSLVDLRPDL